MPQSARTRWTMRGVALAILAGLAATTVVGDPAPDAPPLKNVVLAVDGESRAVQTEAAATVETVLAEAGVTLGPRDLVDPAPAAPLADGQTISVSHARRVVVTIDGKTREMWVTTPDMDAALEALDVREGAYISASRSARIPREGIALSVRTPQKVTLVVKGKKRSVTTTAPTVAELLASERVRPDKDDIVRPSLSAYPKAGTRVTLTRVEGKRVVRKVRIAFATKRVADSDLTRGKERVSRAGRVGVRKQIWSVTRHNGKVVKRTLVKQSVTRKPQTRVVVYGTRKPAPVRAAGFGGYPAYGGLNWYALARCESGNNPRAGGMYRGLYQFHPSTWRSVGGSGDPADASVQEQTYRAWVLYQRSGRSPWPTCGKYL